ncbi:MAG: ribosome biogenesis GTPase Der [Planctomycetaceae bacterium]|nr:ribosome biogenesis GTPase Der [Planctomycetaceae bacterium]
MSVPKVVIVGRPNVGKSSVFNWLAGRMISIVDPTAGVTRDRVAHLMHEGDRYFELIDTGGIGIVDSDNLSDDIERQIQVGIDEADLIVFVVDGKTGPVPLDVTVSERLRKLAKPGLLVVNKCDSPKTDAEIHEFHGMFDGPLVITSVKANRNRDDLLEAILGQLPAAQDLEQEEGASLAADPEMKLAIVGRRNVGKSTFLNALAGEERVIVSEVAGTTRDSIDIRFEIDGRTILAIDTPGVRKKKSLANDIEFYALVRAQRSIRRADVVLMMFDSQETISQVDKKLVQDIQDGTKPCIFVVNKWDLALEKGMTSEKWSKYLFDSFASMRHVPVALVTAKDSRNIRKLINLAQNLYKQANERVSTNELNKIVRAAVMANQPAHKGNRRPKVFFATQVAVAPPTIVLKCNDPALFSDHWKRYLLGVFREHLPFKEVPIRLYLRSRQRTVDEPKHALDELRDDLTPGDAAIASEEDGDFADGPNVESTGVLFEE